MKIFYLVGIIICFPLLSLAQSKGNLSGEVIDKNTQKPVVGATISIANTNIRTITDSLGKYTFKGLPTGQYHLLLMTCVVLSIVMGLLYYAINSLPRFFLTPMERTYWNTMRMLFLM